MRSGRGGDGGDGEDDEQAGRGVRTESGFTLIELLVVIVILGILAAITVIAVAGINEKGNQSATDADVATLQKAEEAYLAKRTNGPDQYATEAELVADKLLARGSTLHDICLSTDKTEYKVVPASTDCTTITF